MACYFGDRTLLDETILAMISGHILTVRQGENAFLVKLVPGYLSNKTAP